MTFASVEAIKAAVDEGREVRWENDGYHVIKDSLGQYLVQYQPNGSCIGLTWRDEVTLNGKLDQFYEVEK